MTQLPSGRVTLLFTDIEGSTGMVQALGTEYAAMLGRHRDVLRRAVESRGGRVVDTLGDETSNVFVDPCDALACGRRGAGRARFRAASACVWASTPASRALER